MTRKVVFRPEAEAEILEARTFRRAVVRNFPYAIFYRVLDAEIVILAVMRGRRDPSRWQGRNG
ncbi:MAG: type II toxin-antitoxin system RelE/ParE family toxin [Candidatus Eisenbacteria bacterium]|uniref:Type II toxin-antitoxin system RelE/ParE family toxin n=1 Tax=Eiseniibacteriota bacterium TaxID=2212470 RepID=A0A956NJ42_UNCEI|nr:type II toxin-antitoxin system RelE/ParE family toxin [Candidatus Eisenbacteria bacterium]MCB9465733.1 type II toxin-antitoxin system RelE/ParE family toxin [Candidatus Eisenbacteria bacterium]